MVQQPHVEVGNTAVDLTDGLAAGCYVAQVLRVGDIGGGCFYLFVKWVSGVFWWRVGL